MKLENREPPTTKQATKQYWHPLTLLHLSRSPSRELSTPMSSESSAVYIPAASLKLDFEELDQAKVRRDVTACFACCVLA